MAVLIVFGVIIGLLAAFVLAALRFGVDSRESLDQDPTRTFRVRFV